MKRFLALALCAGFGQTIWKRRAAYRPKTMTAKAKFLPPKPGMCAQNGLGWLHDKGWVWRRTPGSDEGYRPAADQATSSRVSPRRGHARGDGVPQNNTESVRWNRMAAEQGFADAQANWLGHTVGWAFHRTLRRL